MNRKRSNINRNFMALNAVLFIAVIAITVLFLYLAFTFKRDAEKKKTFTGQYHIEITTDFANESLSVYVNDSLLTDGIMPDTLVALDIDRFAEDHVLMVVDKQTDIATSFNLSKEGSKVVVKKKEGETIIEETPARN